MSWWGWGTTPASPVPPVPPAPPAAEIPPPSSPSPPPGSSSSSAAPSSGEEFPISLESYRDYLSAKILFATGTGSVIGISNGFYMGDMMALYGYSYALGFGVSSTAYFSGTYALRYLRKEDDYINHGVSGFVNGGWMTAAFGGVRKGVFGAIGTLAFFFSSLLCPCIISSVPFSYTIN